MFRAFRVFRGSTLLNGRVAELPRGRAHARHPRTTFFSLLPFPYLIILSAHHIEQREIEASFSS